MITAGPALLCSNDLPMQMLFLPALAAYWINSVQGIAEIREKIDR